MQSDQGPTRLTIETMLTAYNQLTQDDKHRFNAQLAASMQKAQVEECGLSGIVADILAQDKWLQTEMLATTQDVVLKYFKRITLIQKRAKWMLFIRHNQTQVSVKILYFDPQQDDVERLQARHYKPFNLQEVKAADIHISRWFVKKIPNSIESCVVQSEL